MTAVTVTAAQVAPIFEKFGKAEVYTGVAGATITAGQAVYLVNATGLLGLADCDTGAGDNEAQFRGIALNGGGAGQAIDYIMHGCVYGFTLTGNFDTIIYLSATPGALDTGTGATNVVPVGRVFPLSDIILSTGLPTKVLFVDVDMAYEDWNGAI